MGLGHGELPETSFRASEEIGVTICSRYYGKHGRIEGGNLVCYHGREPTKEDEGSVQVGNRRDEV